MNTPTPLIASKHWDVFCTVIDNFGDIGVCWRFARQLAAEHQQYVRLWVDDLHSFKRICPEINPALPIQHCRNVEVHLWSSPFATLTLNDIADVVIEAFACDIPEPYIQLMQQQTTPPLWLNMEYLSAEPWVVDCHALQSPQPQPPLQKTFFFPGFVTGTGGVLREATLITERDNFQNSHQQREAFWHSLGMPAPAHNELRISLFGYDNAINELVNVWSQSPQPITVCAAEGALATQMAQAMGGDKHSSSLQLGQLHLRVLPFVEQDQYDRLLWACDINFVRGEDSFVRAQWAGKPFVWHIYRQEENAHLIKLDAFLALFKANLATASAKAFDDFWQAWNTGQNIANTWPAFIAERKTLEHHLKTWLENQQKIGDFTTNMMIFCQKYL
jgi:uncharacterized repeat protein (TIGR03837 family)